MEYLCLLFLGTQNSSFRLLSDYTRTQTHDLNFFTKIVLNDGITN